MSCFHPLYVRYYDGEFARFGGKLTSTILNNPEPGEEIVPVPCGKCEGCRLDRSRRWADRMLLEFERPAGDLPPRTALFMTLTYADDHLPLVTTTDHQRRGNLCLKDVQDYIKRLRKWVFPRKLRYFLAGEYGDRTFRPHYHAIVFGLSLTDFGDSVPWSSGEQDGSINYVSPTLQRLWQHGNVMVSEANYKTFCYVARYVLKKQFGADASSVYRGRKPPFVVMSRRPGLGMTYFEAEKEYNAASIFDGTDVRLVQRPRVAFDKLKDSDPYLYEILAADRRELARKRQELVLKRVDYDYLTKCKIDEQFFVDKMRSLHKRDF